MNFSLFTRRLVSLPALRTHVASSLVLTLPAFAAARRTFFTTRRIQLPAAASKSASTVGAKKTTRKPAAKKVAPRKAKAKKAAPKKAKAKTKAKRGPKAKPKEKPALPKRVPKSEQPPTRPPNAYILFFTRIAQNHKDKFKTLADTQAVSREAGATWKGFTLTEKQPYYDEVEVLKKQYDDKVQEFWKNAPPQVLRKINARRRVDGKNMIHRPRQNSDNPRPMGPFFRFTQDFRLSPEGRAIQEAGNTSTGRAMVNVAREAGSRWRAMSDYEKAPYMEAYKTEYADWQANHSKGSSESASL